MQMVTDIALFKNHVLTPIIKKNLGLVETPILHLKLHIGAKNFPGFFKSNITLLKSVFFVYT